jgi:hypothetical protein
MEKQCFSCDVGNGFLNVTWHIFQVSESQCTVTLSLLFSKFISLHQTKIVKWIFENYFQPVHHGDGIAWQRLAFVRLFSTKFSWAMNHVNMGLAPHVLGTITLRQYITEMVSHGRDWSLCAFFQQSFLGQ